MRVFRKIVLTALLTAGLVAGAMERHAFALGATAGTAVSNQATVSFTTPAGGNFSASSNLANFLVDEVVRLNVTWQGASTVTVVPGSLNQYRTLALTNTGNGTESFALTTATNLGGDQFDPTSVGLYLDSNNNGIYEPATDLISAANLVMSADEMTRVFIVNNIPNTHSDSSPLQDGDTGLFNVSLASEHGNGTTGTAFPGDGKNGGTAIFGQDFPIIAIGQYEVQAANVVIVKTAVIEDLDGGSQAQPGATITYTLLVGVIGSGTAYGLIISDPVPDETAYIAESLTLDGAQLTDSTDGDVGETSGTPVDLITVNLGDQGTGNHTISFKVTINE